MTYNPTRRPTGRPSRQQEIMDWLQDYIDSGPGGQRLATRVALDGAQRNYNLKALKRAKKVLGFTSIHVGGSEGDWLWVNPRLLRPDNKPIQGLSEKLDKYERQTAQIAVTSKAQSRARIANNWLEQITEELFAQGLTLAEIREHAAKLDRYLTSKEFADIEEEFGLTAMDQLSRAKKAKSEAQEALDQQVRLILDEKPSPPGEMRKAQDAIRTADERLAVLSEQIGPVMLQKLTATRPAA